MEWKCKFCTASAGTRAGLLRHYRLQHSQFSRVSPLPCLYDSCICTFQSFNALKIHLSRFHKEVTSGGLCQELQLGVVFTCPLCEFKQPFSEEALLGHLRSHLRKHEMVTCPYKNCGYSTNVYSSFNTHKARAHAKSPPSEFCEDICSMNDGSEATIIADPDEGPSQSQSTEPVDEDSQCDPIQLRAQLNHSFAALFLKMQTISWHHRK